jgi:hypothetical protein
MDRDADKGVAPGECPLCRSGVPVPAGPRSAGDALAALAQHFGTACAAIAFPPARPAPVPLDALARRDKDMARRRVGAAWPRST